ncbi:MAG: single-stranded-DNA-specific exonuclease RecJ [Saprospiraceae bacterium]|nr:single-stranded-DNA-specific exonuclease RecJ [Saprospiraceae bacterium]
MDNTTHLIHQWKATPYEEEVAHQLQKSLKINPIFCQLLAQRGIQSYEQAKDFFRPQLDQLHDPFLMFGMERAVSRILLALARKEKILLFGDYDVDGTTAVALLYTYLEKHHAILTYYIPDRYKEGYGVSFEGIEHAVQQGVTLLITLDCGISSQAPLRMAKREGIDVIVCDHHLPSEELPDAFAILDPKQTHCSYPYKELSGCGVAFKLAQAINQVTNQPPDWCWELLDFLVISIASDIVDMMGENRILAYYGLKRFQQTERVGLKMLIEKSGKPLPFTINDIVFGLAPFLNAAGRLADATQAVRLLLAKDAKTATEIAEILNRRNLMRKEFDQRIAEEAKILWQAEENWHSKKSIVLYQPHWHKGVVGIVAARMVEHFHRPTIILTESNGKAVGSARSIQGFSIHEAIKSCEDLLINFGGHDHAAGLSLHPQNIPYFQDRFEAIVQITLPNTIADPTIYYSAVVPFQAITPTFWHILQQFAPFGPGNRNPVFVSHQIYDTGYSRLLKEQHIRLIVKQDDTPSMMGIAFGMAQYFESIQSRQKHSICYTLESNQWKDKTYLQMQIKDIKIT